ncbi:siderophore-interacting protein [Nigerium massiliense]|uniref:siderophore-interacting protein n=1 Tax=Nigerium massiliense TaxID=1522317 RepID=UPI0006944F6C|nr:siderophore-interacting protein [Nigerium massiliense]
MSTAYRAFGARLTARRALGESYVRLTLAGELAHVSPTLLDQRVKLAFGSAEALRDLRGAGTDWYAFWQGQPNDVRPAIRTYTLTAVRPALGEVDVDVVIHGAQASAGPGVRFATQAPLGSEVVLIAADRTKPGHDSVGVAWNPREAHRVLVVGDETALPAIENITTTLPANSGGRIIVEVPHEADVRPLEAPTGVDVTWCVRDRGERACDALPFPACAVAEKETDDLVWQEGSGGEAYVWVAGEAGWVNGIRAGAKQAGVPRRQLACMGYWRAGRAGA